MLLPQSLASKATSSHVVSISRVQSPNEITHVKSWHKENAQYTGSVILKAYWNLLHVLREGVFHFIVKTDFISFLLYKDH